MCPVHAPGLLTGAEALVKLLGAAGVSTVFAYPGTSELALCDAMCAAGLKVVNARGDREAAFMAAGANLVRPASAAGLLHGARGLTNALGAVGDARRTEVGVLLLAGTAARSSAPFLPPHADTNLLAAAGQFARAAFDCSEMKGFDATEYLKIATDAASAVRQRPAGPVLLGVPQDLLGERFVPDDHIIELHDADDQTGSGVTVALDLLRSARRPAVIVDDYFLRESTAERSLAEFAAALAAPVFQVAYRRGPMLFQQIRPQHMPGYAAMLDPADALQQAILAEADLLITLEDRNMYPRVIGNLPSCPKLALTSNPPATVKNGYLSSTDVILVGDVQLHVRALTAELGRTDVDSVRLEHGWSNASAVLTHPTAGRQAGSEQGRLLVQALCDGLRTVPAVHIVDDSQMFGGLVALHYSQLPAGADVFGSHSGFVGSGLAVAVGLAQADGRTPVVCLVGDQGYTNGIQALAVAGGLDAALLIILCNNGSSVSLRKQAKSDGLQLHENFTVMGNSPNMNYTTVAEGYGLTAETVCWHDGSSADRLTRAVARALATRRGHLIELLTPDDHVFWQDVWNVAGFETQEVNRQIPGPPRIDLRSGNRAD